MGDDYTKGDYLQVWFDPDVGGLLQNGLNTIVTFNLIFNFTMLAVNLFMCYSFGKEYMATKKLAGIGSANIKRMAGCKLAVSVLASLQCIAAALGDLTPRGSGALVAHDTKLPYLWSHGGMCEAINHIQPFIYVTCSLAMYFFLFAKQRLTKIGSKITPFEYFVLFLIFLEACFSLKVLILMYGANLMGPDYCFIIAYVEDPILMFCLDTVISLLLLWTFIKPLLAEMDKRKSGVSNKVFYEALKRNLICCLGAVVTTILSMLLFVVGQQLFLGLASAPQNFLMVVWWFKCLNFTTTADITANTLFIYFTFRHESKEKIPQEDGGDMEVDSARNSTTVTGGGAAAAPTAQATYAAADTDKPMVNPTEGNIP